MDFKTYANLDEVKMMARGNAMKLADYAVKKHEFEQLRAEHFNEDHPFVKSFNESHLESLRTFAEENPDNQSAQFRYNLQKERFAVQESNKTAHIDRRLMKSRLTEVIQSGKATVSDLDYAETLVRQNGTPENFVIYSNIKKLLDK